MFATASLSMLVELTSWSSGATLTSATYNTRDRSDSLFRWSLMKLPNCLRRLGTEPILEQGAYAPTIVMFDSANRTVTTLPSLFSSACAGLAGSPNPRDTLDGVARDMTITP